MCTHAKSVSIQKKLTTCTCLSITIIPSLLPTQYISIVYFETIGDALVFVYLTHKFDQLYWLVDLHTHAHSIQKAVTNQFSATKHA